MTDRSILANIEIEKDQRGQYAWRCDVCGWAGLGLLSRRSAQEEARQHVDETHGRAVGGVG